jgi:hypothetical protein
MTAQQATAEVFLTILQSGSEENEVGSRRRANGLYRSTQTQSRTGVGPVAHRAGAVESIRSRTVLE